MVKENNRDDGDVKLFQKQLVSHRCWKMKHRHRIALKINHRRGLFLIVWNLSSSSGQAALITKNNIDIMTFLRLWFWFMYCPTEHINNKSYFLGVICYCQSAVFHKRIVPITRKNDKYVAKIANRRLTKILWPFLRSPKGCQLLPPCLTYFFREKKPNLK